MNNFNQGYSVNGYNQYGYNGNHQSNGYNTPQTSHKSKVLSLLLCMFLGVLGIHRFYLGKIGTGILYFLTCGLFGFGVIIDFIRLCTGSLSDKSGLPLKQDITQEGSNCVLKFMVIYYVIAILFSFVFSFFLIFGAGMAGVATFLDNASLTPDEPIVNVRDNMDIIEDIENDLEWVESEPVEEDIIESEPIDTPVLEGYLREDGIYENPMKWTEIDYNFEPTPEWDTGLYTGKLIYNGEEVRNSAEFEAILVETPLKDLMEYDDFYIDYYGRENKPYLCSIFLEDLVVESIDVEQNVVFFTPKDSLIDRPTDSLNVIGALFGGTSISLSNSEKISVGDTVDIMGHIEYDTHKEEFVVYILSIYG